MRYWIIIGILFVVFVAVYLGVFLYTRKKQKAFDEQYLSMKERHEVFVLNKKITKERPQQGWARFMKMKSYQVVGRVTVSQAMRGMQMSKMQTVTFRTTKQEYDKIEINHKYKMDIAGNYIGNVIAPTPSKQKKSSSKTTGGKSESKGKNNKKSNVKS
ncbi:hypothetical protein FY534_10610 [Alicyclobacillus sp. TC]|uniref:Flagellar basal body-associated protein FliL n=2 Tax=Alicyclobacillus tolerans TaxID=90970 RepID=A0ABT9LTT3_9BACL|nr:MULTISPECIES: hypothetical protein [Alicyclobacillus]MDP9727611.1 flagellar basal body-associated protein FliL [Alicyclobacillus tengchongensis]QRF24038.1 hypothetical protein FY534_10610 [Alicyclobacillus sp. TC]SHJ64505.1 hypothetical protein SAMN05443507_10261 [Alicyclobacillus montanus]